MCAPPPQAVIIQHDTNTELQRAATGRHRGNVLLDQEKQRNLEKQREEQASFQRLQTQHRQEQDRWERERERQRLQAESAEAELMQRREECEQQEALLAGEKEELNRQREAYQQDLERLRESTRTVEKEREQLEQQRKKLEKQKKSNTISNPGHFSYEAVQVGQTPESLWVKPGVLSATQTISSFQSRSFTSYISPTYKYKCLCKLQKQRLFHHDTVSFITKRRQ